MRITSFFVATLLLIPSLSFAHGDRPSFEKEVDGYLIDIGYNNIGFRPDEPVTFDIDLYTTSGSIAFVPFTHVRMEIAKDGTTVFDQTLPNDGTNIPMATVTFPDEGAYVMHVTYEDDDTQLVYTTFDLTVDAHSGAVGRTANYATYAAAGLLAILAIVVIVRSFRRRNS